MRGNVSRFYFGALAVAACTVFLVPDARVADAAPLPGIKVCSSQQCDLLHKPERRVLPAGVMFARTSTIAVASDAMGASKDRKEKRSAKKDARKDKRAARRAKRKQPDTS